MDICNHCGKVLEDNDIVTHYRTEKYCFSCTKIALQRAVQTDPTWIRPTTLYDFVKNGVHLTMEEATNFVEKFCKGMRIHNQGRIHHRLTEATATIPLKGILTRVRISADPDKTSYTAGQSWPDEVSTMRQLVLQGR